MRTTTTRTTPIVMAIDSATSDIYSDTPQVGTFDEHHWGISASAINGFDAVRLSLTQIHRRLRMEEVATVAEDYERGVGVAELARRSGVHRVTVRRS